MRRFHTADLAGLVTTAPSRLRFRHTEVRSWPMAKTKDKAPKEPAPMGRPPRAGEASSVVAIRFTASERAAFEAAANDLMIESASGERPMSFSEWVRAACAEKLARAAKRKKG